MNKSSSGRQTPDLRDSKDTYSLSRLIRLTYCVLSIGTTKTWLVCFDCVFVVVVVDHFLWLDGPVGIFELYLDGASVVSLGLYEIWFSFYWSGLQYIMPNACVTVDLYSFHFARQRHHQTTVWSFTKRDFTKVEAFEWQMEDSNTSIEI